jgi:hypothetical protein
MRITILPQPDGECGVHIEGAHDHATATDVLLACLRVAQSFAPLGGAKLSSFMSRPEGQSPEVAEPSSADDTADGSPST